MNVARYIPSMFHRRLLLVMGVVALGLLVLAARLWQLTITKGAELREAADAQLVARHWIPTTRGKILDRKGRVLAQDRASYDVAVAYPMIDNSWAASRARALALKAYRTIWSQLKDDDRDTLVAATQQALEAHAARAWDELSSLLEIPPSELAERRGAIVSRVETMYRTIVEQRREQLKQEAAARDEIITPELERRIERRATTPIAEQGIAHVLSHRVNDRKAFEVQLALGAQVDLPLPAAIGMDDAPTIQVERIPGLSVLDAGDREYPLESMTVSIDRSTLPAPIASKSAASVTIDGIATHVLGWMRNEIQADDVKGRKAAIAADPALAARTLIDDPSSRLARVPVDRGEYRTGDRVGHVGLESSYENSLRGLRGVQTRRLDTGDTPQTLPPEPGRDLKLSLDIQLQARIQALMSPAFGLASVQSWHGHFNEAGQPLDQNNAIISGAAPLGTPLNGSAVVLDVDTGDILSLVSMPSFSRATLRDDPEVVFQDAVNTPWINRAITSAYQPGSIVKALLLTEAVKRRVYSLDERIACTGHFLPDRPDILNCWIFKRFQTTHTDQLGHDLDASDGLMCSCNIFFFTIGKRLGPKGIVAAYRDYGLGAGWNLGIGNEFTGSLGKVGDGSDLEIGDAVQMGIGQGPVAWTPLHAADAYATLARAGVKLAPRLVEGAPREEPRELGLDAAAVSAAMDGLRRSVGEEFGTGHHLTIQTSAETSERELIFNAPGVRVWGKTGTADASPLVVDPDAEGPLKPRVVRDGDHSWFVVLVGREGDRPRYVISVVIDYGGSGGKVSGPIANQIIHALIAEGYL